LYVGQCSKNKDHQFCGPRAIAQMTPPGQVVAFALDEPSDRCHVRCHIESNGKLTEKRAGADVIITSHAKEAAQWLK